MWCPCWSTRWAACCCEKTDHARYDAVIKLISLDLDGTLLGPDGDLTPGAAGAIARAREAGLRVVLNTGRPLTEAGYFARKAGCDNLVSCLGGALLGDAQTGAELRRWDIPQPWGFRALEICLGRGLEITIFLRQPGGAGPLLQGIPAAHLPLPGVPQGRSGDGGPTVLYAGAEHARDQDPRGLGPLPTEGAGGAGEGGAHHLHAHRFLRLSPGGVNKGSTLALIALMYGIPLEQCAAVGDSENDLPMLEAAGLAIAMGNAPEHVRAAARRVVDTNAQGGVVQAILSCLEH